MVGDTSFHAGTAVWIQAPKTDPDFPMEPLKEEGVVIPSDKVCGGEKVHLLLKWSDGSMPHCRDKSHVRGKAGEKDLVAASKFECTSPGESKAKTAYMVDTFTCDAPGTIPALIYTETKGAGYQIFAEKCISLKECKHVK